MKTNYLLLLLIFSLPFLGCSDDETTQPEMQQETPVDDGSPQDTDEFLEASTLLNVSYGSNDQQVYDLYLPAGRKASTTKTIVLVHGGGWTSGDKENMNDFLSFVQDNHPDHAVVNVNYVLANPVVGIPAFPNQYLDLQAVLQQLTDQQEDLQIKAEFGMIGASAGAHLSLMYDYVYDTTDQVKFVIDVVGPTDFTDPFYADDPNFAIALAFFVDEDQYPDGTDLAVANSPALQVTNTSSPTLLFYGDQDPLVPLSNGMSLSNSLDAAEVAHTFTIYQGGHGNDWSAASRADLIAKSSEYVNTYLPID